MTKSAAFAPGNYRFIPGVFQYSGGAAADDGYEIQRVRFRTPVRLTEGFERIERIITQAGRPLTPFCACELRSPAPFTEQGFRAFNEIYSVTTRKWGPVHGQTTRRRQELRHRGQRRGPRRRRELPRAHGAARRADSGRDAREGALR